MKLTDYYSEVSRRADTGKTKIGAADTRRVLSEAFLTLGELNAAEAADIVAKGLATAAKKKVVKKPAAKKPAAKKPAKKITEKRKTAKRSAKKK